MSMDDEKLDISFEKAVQKLEEIIVSLEKGDLSLEDSFSLFQEGMALSKYCASCLEDIDKKIRVLTMSKDKEEEVDFLPNADE